MAGGCSRVTLTSVRAIMLSRCIRSALSMLGLAVALATGLPSLNAQQAPAPGSFFVPQGWSVNSTEQRATISLPNRRVGVSLEVYRDHREPIQVCVDFLNRQMKDKSKTFN